MARKSYNKTRPQTEIEQIRSMFPNFDTTELQLETTTDGKIIKLTTNNPALQALMRAQGFTET